MSAPSASRWPLPTLGLVGAVAVFGYSLLAGQRGWSTADDVWAFLGLMAGLFACYGVGLWACARAEWRGRRAVVLVLVVAAASRLALLPAGSEGWSEVLTDLRAPATPPAYSTYLLYDHDVWRYLWDGRMVLTGVDPYRWSPNEVEEAADDGDELLSWALDEPWATIQTRIGYADYRTIYPPLAQAAFAASTAWAPGSVAAWKLLLLVADLLSCGLLVSWCRRAFDRPALVTIYAWNPLVIKELIGSGHVDALAILGLVAMVWCLDRGRDGLALAALAGAILVKLTPLLIVPLLLRSTRWRSWWILPSLGAVAYAPWLTSLPVIVDSLRAFSRDWAFNAGPWAVLHSVGRALGADGRQIPDLVALSATLALVAWITWRCGSGPAHEVATGAGIILGTYVLVSPTVMPWYLLWALPLLVGSRPGRIVWPVVTGASLLSYLVYIDGVERIGWRLVEFTVIGAIVLWALVSCRVRAVP